jgi:hypothetical protein
MLYMIFIDILWCQKISSSIIYSMDYNCISFINHFPDVGKGKNVIATVMVELVNVTKQEMNQVTVVKKYKGVGIKMKNSRYISFRLLQCHC